MFTALAGLLVFASPAAGDPFDLNDVVIVATQQSPDETGIVFAVFDSRAVAANLEFDVPSGYTLDTSGAVGSSVAQFDGLAGGTGGLASPQGDVVVADPATYTDPTSVACDPQTHLAVWTMAFGGSFGASVTVPLFVDAGASSGYAIHVCLPASAFGPKASPLALLELDFPATGALHSPTAPGTYLWHVLMTPFGDDGLTPDATKMVEFQAPVPLPVVLTMKATYNAHTKLATVTGKLLLAGAPAEGYTIDLAASKTASGDGTALRSAVTIANGTFSFIARVTKSEYIRAVPEGSTTDCTSATGIPCTSSEFPVATAVAHVVVPKPKPVVTKKKKK